MSTFGAQEIYVRKYPPDQEADEIAASASAYSAYDRRPGQEGIDKIPQGFVSRQRELFAKQQSTLVEETKTLTLSPPLPADALRRKSAPTISVYVSKNPHHAHPTPDSVSSTPYQTSSVSLELSSLLSISSGQSQVSRTSSKSPETVASVIEEANLRKVHESVPSSSYLVWKSQEVIQKRRGSDPTTAQKMENVTESLTVNRPSSQPEPTFRTIIMFGNDESPKSANLKANKKDPEKVYEKPKPVKVLPKSAEMLQKINRTTSNASTATVSPTTEDYSSSPNSTPDLLKINSSSASEDSQLSPATIRRNCERIMKIVQKFGCQIPEEDFEELENSSIAMDPSKRTQIWSTYDHTPKTDSIKRMSQNQDPRLHVEIPNLTPKKPSNGFQNGAIENQIIRLKDEEIQRLQRELSEAHVCNQRLNSQIGVLASKESHATEKGLKKQLKEKNNEIDQWRKKYEKAEKDRQQLVSRQPPDVQTLQSQKRELQMQLEREENEKHELFLQINQLIAQLADSRPQESSKDLKDENERLHSRIEHLESELKSSTSTADRSLQNAQNELSTLKDELVRVLATHDLEKNRLQQEIEGYQKEVQIKSAALQSLRLAKQEPKEDPAVVSKLNAENASLRQDLEKAQKQLEESSSHLASAQKLCEVSNQKVSDLSQQMNTLQLRLEKAEKLAVEKSQEYESQKEEMLHLGASRSSEMTELQRGLEEKSRKIDDLSKTLSEIRSEAETSQNLADELNQKLTLANHRIEDIEADLKDKDQAYVDLENRLKTLQTELRVSKSSSETKNSELDTTRQQLEEVTEQLRRVKIELEGVKEEKSSLQDQVSKKSSEMELSQKDVEGLKYKIQNLEKENQRLMEKASVEEELMTLVTSLQAARSEISSKETEISDLRRKLHDIQDESDRLATELRQTHSALAHAQEENSRLAGQDVQLAEYRVEAEKRLEQVRSELTQELEGARSEGSQWRSEAVSLKSRCEKLESEFKEMVHTSEIRHSRSQELEVEKKRLETLLEESIQKLKEVENQAQQESTLRAKSEDLISTLKPLEFQLELKTNELETTQKELASKISELEGLKNELVKKEDRLSSLESEYQALKTVQETSKTDEATKLARMEADLQTERDAKLKLSSDLQEALEKLSTAETTLAIASKAKSTLELELHDLKSHHDSLNQKFAQLEQEKGALEDRKSTLEAQQSSLVEQKSTLEVQLADMKSRLLEAETQLSGSSDLAKELVDLKTKLSEVEAKYGVLEKNFEDSQKVVKEKEALITELKAKDQEYSKLDMEIGVLRTSLGQMQTQFGVHDTEKQELKDKITELTFELEQRQADHEKLVKSESHNNLLRQEKTELEQTLALLEKKLDQSEKALEKQMGAREEELTSQLSALKTKLEEAEEAKKKSDLELEKAKMDFTEGLKKAQEEANENIRRLTDLMSSQAMQIPTLTKEKEVLMVQVEEYKMEKERIAEKLRTLEAELANKPTIAVSDEELQQKVNELMEENARLAGDLLKQQRKPSITSETDSSQVRQEFEKILQQKQQDWQKQKSTLESKLDEAEVAAEQANEKLKVIRVERDTLEEELKKLKMNGATEPVPKPRKFTASLSNLTFDTMSERSITPSHDEEEIKKLRAELEKQKRLVTVLRKKIQQPQIEAKIQSRASMSPMGSNGSVTPNRI